MPRWEQSQKYYYKRSKRRVRKKRKRYVPYAAAGISLALVLSNFGIFGRAGNAAVNVLFGLFGFGEYFFPVILYFLIRKWAGKKQTFPLAEHYVLMFASLVLMELICSGLHTPEVMQCFLRAYDGGIHLGGGLVGGFFARLFTSAFGLVGAYLIIATVMFIAIARIIQKPVLKIAWNGLISFTHICSEKCVALMNCMQKKREKVVSQKNVFKNTDLPVRKRTLKGDPVQPKTVSQKNTASSRRSPSNVMKNIVVQKQKPVVNVSPNVLNMPSDKVKDVEKPIRKARTSAKPKTAKAAVKDSSYVLPDISLLTKGASTKAVAKGDILRAASKLECTLKIFGVNASVVSVDQGPTVTRFEVKPDAGVKVSRILSLQDDIKLNLAATDIRIEAPIPGKAAVGIEVPNKTTTPVMMRDILETEEFQHSKAKLAFAVGKDIAGHPVIADIEKMPHLLIAGATGSGKSVCLNTLIMSLLYKYTPEDVRMIMIDPKMVELSIYNGIPHLLMPVVTDAKKAANDLEWVVREMTDRYQKFAEHPGIRDIKAYNKYVKQNQLGSPMPQIVVIIDELADLMSVASKEVEGSICRISQLARAAGIHLIIATQRPSVDVVTGLIKANMPSRIALAMSSGTDSRTILDMNGAEHLLGKGDMLFYPQNYPAPKRVQGAFLTDEDISKVCAFLEENNPETEQVVVPDAVSQEGTSKEAPKNDLDEYFIQSGNLIIKNQKASIGMLQRAFSIGFNRAARIMDQLHDHGVVGESLGAKPREILMDQEKFDELAKMLS